jgi:ArsR family transcriptional regulator
MKESKKDEIKEIRKKFQKNSSYKFLRESMEIIGNEDRFLILNLLNNKPCLLADIEKEMKKSQPSISHHLRILEKYNLIKTSQKGKFNEYSISREKFEKLLNIWNQWYDAIRLKDFQM